MSEEIDKELDELESAQADDKATDDEKLIAKSDDKGGEKPPGFISYDEWVDSGKDPADFRGENAYKAHYDSLKEVRELKGTMNHVVDGMETWKRQQNEIKAQEIEGAKAQAVVDLAKAKDDDDLDAALLAQGRITTLDRQAAIAPQPNPVITDFASNNPIIDPNSPQYDADFHQDMRMIHNGKLDQLLGGDRSRASELTRQQIERVQLLAFNQAKELHADKFVSPRNNRQSTATQTKRPAKSADPITKLKTVGNSKNPRDNSPAADLYEILKASDPKVAETFAKNVIGE